ncbi:alpha,alpha-trehalase TreF [Pseudoalteromonas fenneropenaei]|uniref:Alpha,alpha-trehalase TreF n=1 Tax=Pseudoalteromonas fenneropenaei TaxID=1737459 RepID=A0ABV7CQ80_9GAMM
MKFEHSALFKAVQSSGLFPDSKTFADALPKVSWQHAMQTYEQNPVADLATFVAAHFDFAQSPELAPLPDFNDVRAYIEHLWSCLARDAQTQGQGSLLPLPAPYIVPGGRFNEIYYWDSYFTALGLMDSGRHSQVAAMLDNFISLIMTFGHVPNGNRSYYLSRSQPPVTALMAGLLWPHQQHDLSWVRKVCDALEREYAFWMTGAALLGEQHVAARRVVRMPCGALLNRYWDDEAEPRPESYKEDVEAAAKLAPAERAGFYREIRAACESGWDFSSRWLACADDLRSIHTTSRIPIDLNALLVMLEQQLSRCYSALGEPQQALRYVQLAKQRTEAIERYCWHEENGWYHDYNFVSGTSTSVQSLAATTMLFAGLTSASQAERMATRLANKFLQAGGLVTTLTTSAQQWDSPNGWAPLQWFGVSGLLRYGFDELAHTIMRRWINMVEMDFARHGCLLEKYNVCDLHARAGGGEYLVQQGFGWTNGVTQRFYTLLGE